MRDFDLIDFILLDDILHHHDSGSAPNQGHGCCGTCLLWFVLMVGGGVWLITELVRVLI
jgi:hypothetical protein